MFRIALALALLTGTAHAQAIPGPAGVPGAAPPTNSANQTEMKQSADRMNRDMTVVPLTGDPDRDLVLMMMPHHQGAIDMARVYLRNARDPTIRRMAQKIIADQEREIVQFKAWLAKHPAKG